MAASIARVFAEPGVVFGRRAVVNILPELPQLFFLDAHNTSYAILHDDGRLDAPWRRRRLHQALTDRERR